MCIRDRPYQVRPATADDIPVLQELYTAHLGRSLIARLRTPELWRYEMFGSNPESLWTLKLKMVLTPDDEVVGYVNYEPFGTAIALSLIHISYPISMSARAPTARICRRPTSS